MCTFNSFYLQTFLQNFLHTLYYTVHGPVSTWSLKSNEALEKLLVGKNFTRAAELMFMFLISLTNIYICKCFSLYDINNEIDVQFCMNTFDHVISMRMNTIFSLQYIWVIVLLSHS